MSVILRYRKTKDKGYSLSLDIYQSGKRKTETLNIYTKHDYSDSKDVKPEDKEKVAIAEKVKLTRELAIKNEDYSFTDKEKKQTTDFIEYFTNLSKTKGSNYNSALIKLKEFSDKISFAELSEKKIKEFITFLQSKGLKDNTVAQYYTILTAVFNEAVRDGYIATNPILKLKKSDKPKKQDSKREYLTIDELRKINETEFKGNKQIKQAFLFGCFTGLRISDIKLLSYDKIREGKIVYFQKKTKRLEYLPLSKQAIKILSEVERNEVSESVFWDLPKSDTGANRALCDWAKAAGIDKHLHWHIARHTYGTLALANGTDIFTVQKLMGHSSVNVTMIYAKIMDVTKQKAMDDMPEL